MEVKTEEGIVLETDGSTAKVRAGRHTECENCGACPGSGASVLTVQNTIDAHVGQRVLFEIRDEQSLKGAFLIFVLPLLALFAGVWLGGALFSALSLSVPVGRVAGGAVLFALSALLVRHADKKHCSALPAIVKIIG
ncbi:positive regulator of sigma(E), RseC/MucC [Sporobacter termitidis DSM 10068]|uniref:Positive regulator of sigma(E), RseC/MucC n=1 Tax=Sporobacter termitidis DSM 10068 TaxID=1123282 RepID=A0A1M5UIJ9_9FIRM|nr:SoxR reducing system RseC family protein [Sporobacter termitidis]SHH62807.1 positive regulator of sigma(E), RseC/MucC [Sporobacter termitidis DSM 10068]